MVVVGFYCLDFWLSVFIAVRDIILGFSEFSGFFGVSTSATDCLKSLVSEMTCYVLSETLNCCYYLCLHG